MTPKTKKYAVAAVKWTLTLLVFVFLGRELVRSSDEFRRYEWNLQYGWLAAAALLYLAAYFPSSCFWHYVLRALGQRPTFFASVRSFYLSQLGKYVPGKAMVIVIRSALVSGPRVRASLAAAGVFYETFTMMAVGAFISALLVLLKYGEHWKFSLLALGVMAASGIPLLPPVFRRVLKIFRAAKDDAAAWEKIDRLSWKTLPAGFLLMSLLWVLFGLFLWASVRGLGVETGPLAEHAVLFVTVTATAMVLGFAVPISPGGLGVREAILAALLVPYFSTILSYPENAAIGLDAKTLALVVSLAQRVISILAELAAGALFCGAGFFCKAEKE
ncbi:MAG: flippase-like domain-containing protein [Thermoguttaceae bacterium]|nr:flippase-like domain-containing protein [Thermoguttaceae bacterium]